MLTKTIWKLYFDIDMRNFALIMLISLLILLVFADSLKQLLRAGDHFFERGEYHDALEHYYRANSLSPDDPQVQWRIGAALNRIAMGLISKPQNDTLKVANEILKQAIRADKNIPQVHSELAWNLTYISLLQGNQNDFAIARRIKEEVDYALSLDSTIAEAHYILGLWNSKMSGISILRRKPHGLGDASLGKAIEELNRATDLKPDCALFKVELAKQYLVIGDTTIAKGILKSVSDLPDVPANRLHKENAQKMLKDISEQ